MFLLSKNTKKLLLNYILITIKLHSTLEMLIPIYLLIISDFYIPVFFLMIKFFIKLQITLIFSPLDFITLLINYIKDSNLISIKLYRYF